MNSILLQLIIASFIVGASGGLYVGYKYNDGKHAIKTTATMTMQASAVAHARTEEQSIAKSYVATSKTYQEGLNDGKKELNTAIDKLRAERLRNRTATSASVSSNPTCTSGCNGEAGAYISEEIARIGAEADDITRQLKAAQELLMGRAAALQSKKPAN
jgi:hypothetical protein